MSILNQSTVTWLAAKQRILRPVDKQGDTNSLTAAGDILQGIIFTLNNKRAWKWTQNVTTATVGTDGLMTVPTRFKRFYGVNLGGQALRQLERRDVLRQNPLGESVGGVLYYVPFNLTTTSQVEVLDHPSAAASATLYYTKLITVPAADVDTFEVPEDFMDYIILKGKQMVCADFGGSDGQISTYRAEALDALRGLLLDDARTPDMDQCFSPGAVIDAMSSPVLYSDQFWP